MSQLTEILPKNYGYVVLAVAGGGLLNIYHMYTVAKARKRFEVEVPAMSSKENPEFNCVMRSHQNYLENYPFFATNMLLGGIQYPLTCAGAGVVWLISRRLFAYYYTTDPSKRGRGFRPAFFAQLVMLGCTIGFGMRHAGVIASCRSRFLR